MKVLITGATGYLGGHFCQFLKERGHKVTGFIRNQEKAQNLNEWGIPFILGDISDPSTIEKALAIQFDLVIHCAGYVSDRGSWKKFRRINVEGTENLAQAMINTGHKRLIHISSVAAYGDIGLYISEQTKPKKRSWFKYGTTKLESEELLLDYDLDLTILRPCHIVGIRDRTGFVPVIYHSIRKSSTWINKGNAIIPVVYIFDMCEALNLCLEKPDKTIGETFNVSSDEIITIRDMVQIFHEILGLKLPQKSWGFRFAYSLAWFFELLSNFGFNPPVTRMAIVMGGKSSSFNAEKLREIGWKTTKTGVEIVSEWAQWRKEFELSRESN